MTTNPPRIAADVAGGQAKLAKAVGVNRQAVWQWVRDGRIPRAKIADVARATKLPVEVLAPDIFGPTPAAER